MPRHTPYTHRGTYNAGLSRIPRLGLIYRQEGLEYWTLNLTISGVGKFHTIGRQVVPGDCVLIPPRLENNYGTDSAVSDHWHHYWATFPHHPLLADVLQWSQSADQHSFTTLPRGPIASNCQEAFAIMVQRADEAWPMRDELCLSQLRVVLSWMSPQRKVAQHIGSLQRAIDEIHAAPERDWSISELATLVGWSSSRLSHVFTAEIGLPPRRYIEQCRMRLAQGLLHGSELSIAEISQRIGLSDPNYFCRRFSHLYGTNPSNYRQSVRH